MIPVDTSAWTYQELVERHRETEDPYPGVSGYDLADPARPGIEESAGGPPALLTDARQSVAQEAPWVLLLPEPGGPVVVPARQRGAA